MNSFSEQIKKSNTDEWYTPESAVRYIIPYLKAKGYSKILCPFDTSDSNFVKLLVEEGFNVTYGHIDIGQDFFERKDLYEYDCIVSNPPFSKRQKILEKLFEVGIPFALILNSNGIFDAKSRWELFKNNQFEILVPKGRVSYTNKTGDIKSSPNFQSWYICSKVLDDKIVFIE